MNTSERSVPLAQYHMAGLPRVTIGRLIFAALALVFVVLRFWNLTPFGIWGSEAFAVIGSRMGWLDMFAYIVEDVVHPPLVYILLKLWMDIGGDSTLWLKLFPTLMGVAALVPFYLLCKELNLRQSTINLALVLMAANSYLIHYTQELRMYVLLMLMTLWSLWLFARYFRQQQENRRLLIVLTIVNLLLVYSHYYGWVVVGMEFLYLLLARDRRLVPFTISSVILGALYVPWAVLVGLAALDKGGLGPNLDWVPRPSIDSLVNLFANFHGFLPFRGQDLVGLAVFGLPVLIGGGQMLISRQNDSQQERQTILALGMFIVLPVIGLFIVSRFLPQAVFTSRYFIFITMPYLLLIAIMADRLRPTWLRLVVIMLVAGWSIGAGIYDSYTHRMAWESPQVGSRADWPELAAQMSAAEPVQTGPIPVYTLTVVSRDLQTGNWAVSTSLDYYFDALEDRRFTFVFAQDIDAMLDLVNEDFAWVGYFVLNEDDTEVREELAAAGHTIDHVLQFANRDQYVALIRVTWNKEALP